VATLEDLRVPAVADMMMPQIGGHFVAVLAVQGDGMLLGDPLSGLGLGPQGEFMADWRHWVEMGVRK
jgi:predicted double-glycine peptidase